MSRVNNVACYLQLYTMITVYFDCRRLNIHSRANTINLIDISVRQIMCACSSYILINKQKMKRRKVRLKTENATK